jgi:hypothetical protein
MKMEKIVFNSFYCLLFQLLNRKFMFAVLHSDISSVKYSLRYLTGQPYSPKGRSVKVKDGNISETKFLGTMSVD